MGKLDRPGYPLPDGELGDDELACTIVYYPDRPEYRQALVSSLLYLGNWLAWERDEDKRGKDASANWKAANDLSLECLYMSCFEQLQSDVSDILDHIRNTVPCCGDTITYGDSTVYITTIIPGQGGDPSFYGETAVADWDEWLEYLCYSAHRWVDELVSNANTIELSLSLGGLTMAMLAYVFGAFNFLFMRGSINSSTLVLRLVNMIAGYTISLFSDAADDIETARDDIVCAIINGLDVGVTVEDALSSGVAWDLLYSLIDYDSAVAILYEGGDGESYLEAVKDATCDCEQIGEYLSFTDWETQTYEGWQNVGGAIINSGRGGGWCWKKSMNETHHIFHSVLTLCDKEGLPRPAGTKIWIHRVHFWYKMTGGGSQQAEMWNAHDGGNEVNTYPYSAGWTEVTEIFSPPLESTYNKDPVIHLDHVGSQYQIWYDDITIDFDHQSG